MSFINEIKTILKLDDKDWKKALSSISDAEKSYVKESKKNTEDLISAKTTLLNLEKDKATSIKSINADIKKSEEDLNKAILSNDLKTQASIKKTIALKKEELAQIKATSKDAMIDARLQVKTIANTISTQNQYNTLLKKAKEAHQDVIAPVEKHNASMSNLANTTIRYLRWAGTIAGVVYAAQRAWQSTLGAGIEVNKMMEDNTAGIAALLTANTSMILSNGQVVNSYEKFQMGLIKSKSIIDDIRIASKNTYATFPQLTEIFQQAIGQTLSLGTSFGTTVDDISKNTIKLAQRMSNIGGAIGQPMDRIKEEIRSLISGNASTDSLISTMIFGSPSQANEAIRKAKESGTNGLKDMLESYIGVFDVLEGVKTYTKAQLDLQDAISQTQKVLSEPTFNALKDIFVDLAVVIRDNEAKFKEWGENVVTAAKFVIDIADEVLIALLGWKVLPLTISAVKIALVALSEATVVAGASAVNLGKNFSMATIKAEGLALATTTLGKSMKALAVAGGPMLLAIAAYETYNWLLGDSAKREETLLGLLSKKKEDLNAISSEQLIYNEALLAASLIDKEADAWKKRVDAANYRSKNKLGELTQEQSIEQKRLNAEAKAAQEALDSTREQIANSNYVLKTRDEILKKNKEISKVEKEIGELSVKLTKNAKIEEEIKSFTKKEETELVKLARQKAEWNAEIVKSEKELAEVKANFKNDKVKFEDIDEIKKQQAYIQNLKNAVLDTDKKIAEEKEKANDKSISSAKTEYKTALELNRAKAQELEYDAKLAMYRSGAVDEDRLSISLQEIKISALADEYAALTNTVDLKDKEIEIYEAVFQLNKLITTEKEKQEKADIKAMSFKKINQSIETKDLDQEGLTQLAEGLRLTFADDAINSKALEKEIEKWQNKLDEKSLTLDIKLQGFDDISNSIADVGNSFQSMQKASKEYEKQSKSLVDNPVKLKQAQLDYADATMSTYSDMAGALASFYDEDDSRREKQLELQKFMNATKMAMQLAELAQTVTVETAKGQLFATNALVAQLQLPFPANIPAFAAVSAMIASLGIMIGGGESISSSSDAFSSMEANTGTGSILGDAEAQSESISKALDTLEDFAQPQYQTLQSMNSYLKSIASNIGGVTSLLIQSGGFAFGEGYEGYDTGFSNNLSIDSGLMGVINPISITDKLLSKIPVLDIFSGFSSGIINSVLGGLFGKTSVSQKLTDSGIYFADTLLTTATESILGEAYQTISTTTKKKSWFSSSSSTSVSSYFEDLDAETNRQFSLVLDNLYQTTLLAGTALDSSSEATAKSLENFVVSIGKISLKGKTGDEIQETLTAIFGKIGDDIAKASFPLLTSFQGVGEGMFETLTRVATGMEEAEYYINRLGVAFEDLSYTDILNKQGDVGFEALLQSIIKTDEATNGLNNNLIQIIASLDSTAEELYSVYITLDTLRDTLKFLKLETEAISFASITGAGSLDALSSGISAYIENFLTDEEQLSYNTALLEKEFSRLNIAMPVSKDAFTTLIKSLDLSSESGQELYGRLIILSEGFAEVADEVEDTIATLTESLATLAEDGFATFSDSLSDLFDLAVSLAASTRSTIQSLKYSETEDNTNQLIRFNQLLKDFEASKLTTDTEATSAIYSEILSLSSTIGSDSDYSQDIISKLNTQLNGFEADKDIIRVNIVDGLGALLNLNSEQLAQLQASIRDGKLTNTELSNITDLTETQKEGITTFANNSDYFSTESTLSTLEEYAKKQLALFQAEYESEAVKVSSSTFTFGDYTGKQEQIDIAKLTGLSGDALNSFITQVQGLSVSKDLSKDVQSLMGYTGTSYDAGMAADLSAISPYLGSNITNAISSTKTSASTNLAAQKAAALAAQKAAELAAFNTRYSSAIAIYNKEKIESDAAKQAYLSVPYTYLRSGYKPTQEEDIANNKALDRGVNGRDVFMYPIAWQRSYVATGDAYRTEFAQTATAYDAVQLLLSEKALKGYATGGYTGDGAKYDVAGLVHKGEYVINQENLKSMGGENSVKSIVGGGLQKSLDYLSAVNTKTLEKLDIISQNFIKLLDNTSRQTLILESSYSVMKDIKGNTAP